MFDPPHGDHRRYQNKRLRCRCAPCRQANTVHQREYRAKPRRLKSVSPLTDEHVARLRAMELDGTLTDYCDRLLVFCHEAQEPHHKQRAAA